MFSMLSEVSVVEVDSNMCACGTDLCDVNSSGVSICNIHCGLHNNMANNNMFHGIQLAILVTFPEREDNIHIL